MTEYIFYTTEGFTQAPDGEDVGNCQLLGLAYGEDKHDALLNLLKMNPWIEQRGFNPYKAIGKELRDRTLNDSEFNLALRQIKFHRKKGCNVWCSGNGLNAYIVSKGN